MIGKAPERVVSPDIGLAQNKCVAQLFPFDFCWSGFGLQSELDCWSHGFIRAVIQEYKKCWNFSLYKSS